MGRGWFYYLTIGSILAVLALSANTSYADFPRLTRAIAMHDYLPHVFKIRGRPAALLPRDRGAGRLHRTLADRLRRRN